MAQTRYYNFGGTRSNETEKFVHGALNRRGVYVGFDIGVEDDTGNVLVNPGAALQFNGLLWQEDAAFALPFDVDAVPKNYTVVARHDDRSIKGGVPVVYALEAGLLSNHDIANGIVLGWIRHPGGVILEEEHITNAPKLSEHDYAQVVVDTAPIDLVPPFTHYALSSVGVDISFTPSEFDVVNFVAAQKVENALGAFPVVQTAIQNFVFFVRSGYQPIELQLYTEFPGSPSTHLTVEVYDTDHAPVGVTGGTILGMGDWTHNIVTIDRNVGVFDTGEPYTIRLTYTINQGEYIRVGRLMVQTSPFL